ncbi:MAG: HRDC domain-containing protein [Verrucomicrobiota bacterium]|jgi:hypothetical protein
MKVTVFWIPVVGGEAVVEALNRHLASRRILGLDKVFCVGGPTQAPGWSVWVTEDGGTGGGGQPGDGGSRRGSGTGPKGEVDYRETLDPETFQIFAGLRRWRKTAAAVRSEPLYVVASNEHLAEMARRRITTVEELGTLEGFGKGSLERHGAGLVAELARLMGELGRRSEEPASAAGPDGNDLGEDGTEGRGRG